MVSEVNERTAIEILVTEEDKIGSNIMCMSDFFDIAVHQMSNTLVCAKNNLEMNVLPVSDLSVVNNALQTVGAFCSPKFDLVPDFASLPKDILEKYKAGKIVFGDSKQVEGNIRAVLIDVETKQRVKDVTLKKLERTDQTAGISRDMVTQMQLRQISEKIDYMESEQTYLIEFARNQAIMRPFLDARDFILSAQNATAEIDQKENLEKAAEKMRTAINAVYVDMTTIEGEFAKEGNRKWFTRINRSNIDKQISRLTKDMQIVTRYVGLQSQVYHYLGKTEEQKSVIGTYNRRVSRFFDKGIVATDKSLAMFIHENIEYDANNIDCWYNFEQEMKPLLNSAYEELQAKEVYVITAEEDQKDVK
ncbi:MAG: hypothetical protein IJE60_05215 [Tyzzerella sp.]|nr:hypothetical protein [Tyzzerella sp.]